MWIGNVTRTNNRRATGAMPVPSVARASVVSCGVNPALTILQNYKIASGTQTKNRTREDASVQYTQAGRRSVINFNDANASIAITSAEPFGDI